MDYTNFAIPKVTYREKRPNRKKRKLETFKGVKIPPKKVRGSISKKDYEKALEYYGGGCAITGNPNVEMHHVKFRSQGGRGKWYNLIPLSVELHKLAHKDKDFADLLRQQKETLFGEWYFADKFDLWKAGLIVNCTDEAFEKFFEERKR